MIVTASRLARLLAALLPIVIVPFTVYSAPALDVQSYLSVVDSRAIGPGETFPELRILWELQREDYTSGVTWSSDSAMVAAYSENGNLVTVWDAKGTVLRELHRPGAADGTMALAFAAGNTQIATPPARNESKSIAFSLFDIETGRVAQEVAGPQSGSRGRANWAHLLVSSPDQTLLAVAFRPPGQPVILYSTADWSKYAEVPMSPSEVPIKINFSANGKYLAIATALNVLIYDIVDRQVSQRIKAFSLEAEECCISAVAFNPDASLLAVSRAGIWARNCGPGASSSCRPTATSEPIRIFRLTDAARVVAYPSPIAPIYDMGWSHDGRFIAILDGRALHLWNPAQPNWQSSVDLRAESLSLSFAPNGNWITVCDGKFVKNFQITQRDIGR